jgi:hypothetical protein
MEVNNEEVVEHMHMKGEVCNEVVSKKIDIGSEEGNTDIEKREKLRSGMKKGLMSMFNKIGGEHEVEMIHDSVLVENSVLVERVAEVSERGDTDAEKRKKMRSKMG